MGKTEWRPHHEKENPFVVYSHNRIWKPKKNYGVFNAQGFQGLELTKTKKSNEYRILAIGDSNTAGPFSALGWVEYLERLFEKRRANVRVINAGVWGYSSWQGLKHFKEFLKYMPDVVLVSFGGNDAHRGAVSDKEYISSKRFFKIVHHLRLCQLFMHFTDIQSIKKETKNSLIPRVNLSEYKENLNAIADLGEKNNIRVIFLTRPNFPHLDPPPHHLAWISFASQYNKITKAVAKYRKIEFIDVYSRFKDKGEYFVDDGHFNGRGHKIAAKLIFDHIVNESSFQ